MKITLKTSVKLVGIIKIDGNKDLLKVEWVHLSKDINMIILTKNTSEVFKFVGFPDQSFDKLSSHFQTCFNKEISKISATVEGHPFGIFSTNEDNASLRVLSVNNNSLISDFSCSNVSLCKDLGKGELSLEFSLETTPLKECEAVSEIKFFIPDDHFLNDARRFVLSKNLNLEQDGIHKGLISTFENVKLELPRGNFKIEFFDFGLKFGGKSMDFSVKYTNISRVFMLYDSDE
jgi:structure-specific recognition protein 1